MKKLPSSKAPSCAVDKYIGTDFDHVVNVSKEMESVKEVAEVTEHIVVTGSNIEAIKTVATNIGDVNNVSDNMEYVKDVAAGIEGLPVVSYIGSEPPAQPVEGATWYCTTDGRTYVWYKDTDSYQWVESSPQSIAKEDVRTPIVARAALERALLLDGYTLVTGSFELGATLTKATDVILQEVTGKVYSWGGSFPATVPAGSTPDSTGGIGSNTWTLRSVPEVLKRIEAEEADTQDWKGFTEELLAQAGTTDNGQPDKLGASQRVDAIKQLEKAASKVTKTGGGSVQDFIDNLDTLAEVLLHNSVNDHDLNEAMRRNYKYTLRYPPNVENNHLLPIPIYNKSGKYFTDFDPRNLKPVRVQTRYVNPITGSDSNNGGSGDPYKSVARALTAAQTVDMEIILQSGDYYYLDGWKGVNPTKGVSVICPDGVATLTNEAYPRDWVEDPLVQGVYIADTVTLGEDLLAIKSNIRFIVEGRASETARGYQLTEKLAGDIDAGAVGFVMGGTSTRVRLPFNENPNTRMKVVYAQQNVFVQANGLTDEVIYIENINTLYGSPNSARFDTSTVGSKCVLINCKFNHGHNNDTLEINGTGLTVVYRCEANGGYADGFNYQTNSAVSGTGKHDIVEIECKSRRNGISLTGANNGSTIHGTCNIIRLNCDHSYNQNRNVHDVGTSRSFNVGCRAEGSETYMSGFQSGLDNGIEQSQMWLVGCKSDKTTVELNSLLYLSDDTVESVLLNSGGVINTYNP